MPENQTDLLDPPPPPTGPPGTIPSREQNRYQAYLKWKATPEGARVMAAIRELARWALQTGDKRLAAKGLVEQIRRQEQVEINNTYTAWIADDLIRSDPRLLNLIERRKRKKETHG